MISLKIKGQKATLPPKQAVTLYKGAGLLDFSALETTISVPLSLPDNDENRRATGHLYRPASLSGFTPLAASLEYSGALIAQGEFLATSSQERNSLEGFFRGDAGAVASRKDELIGSILKGHTLSFQESDLSNPAYTDLDADIVLPEMVWRRRQRYLDNFQQEVLVNHPSSAPDIGPAFKLRHILKMVFEELGYTVYMEAEDYIHRQAILFGKKSRNFSQVGLVWNTSYEELLPEITLSAFIRSCRTLGFAIGINSQLNEVRVKSISEVFSSAPQDWTAQASPFPQIEPAYGEGNSEMVYNHEPELEYTLEVEAASDLGTGELDEVALVKEEGRLYQYRQFGNEGDGYMEWRQADLATAKYTVSKDGFDAECDFVPCPNADTFYFRGSGARLREAPNGNTLIRPINRFFNRDFQVSIEEPELGEQWYTQTRNIIGTAEIGLPYSEDYDNIDLSYKLNLFRQMPDWIEELQGKPVISVYHGIQDGYPYASPEGLRWEELAEQELSPLKEVVENGKQATFRLRPKPSQIASFSPLRPIEIDGVRYIPKRLELKLGRTIQGELEAWIAS